MSKVSAIYHIVFCTKHREKTIPSEFREDVYRFIWKEIVSKKCTLIRIGGVENHIHLLIYLHPTVALATLMKEIKGITSGWMKSDERFPDFNGWGEGYFACTISPKDKDGVINYINGQEEHHHGSALEKELWEMCKRAGVRLDDRDLI